MTATIIEGSSKEIADLVLTIQSRQSVINILAHASQKSTEQETDKIKNWIREAIDDIAQELQRKFSN